MKQRFDRTDLAICVALLAVVLAIYLPVRDFAFVNYDDPDFVSANPHVRAGLTAESIAWSFRSLDAANWFPLTWLSYMAGYRFYGLDAGAHHLTNGMLHAISSLLLFAILRRITAARWRSAFVAFVFAAHPLHVEAVAWIAERREVLSGLFWTLTIWAYAAYAARPSPHRYLLVIAMCCAALMSKPMAVTLPFALLLLDRWPLDRWRTTGPRRLIIEKLPMIVLSAGAAAITMIAQRAGGAVSSLGRVPLALRIENAIVSYAIYVRQFFWPARLAVIYPYPREIPIWQVIGAALLLVSITTLAIFQIKRRPWLAVGWFWFLGTLVPVIGLVQVGVQSHADRYMYIPLIGLSIMLAWGLQELHLPRRAVGAAAVLACCAWVIVAASDLLAWRDSTALFQHAVDADAANWAAHNGLAHALLRQGRIEEALAHVQAAIRLEPHSADAHVIFGDALNQRGEMDAAETHFRIALQLEPTLPDAQEGLGVVLTEKGQFEEARARLTEAVRLRPDDADSHYNFGRLYGVTGQTDQAIAEFREATRLSPENPSAYDNLGTALAAAGRFDQAVEQFRASLRLDPDNAGAHLNLGGALASLGRYDDAIAEFQQVLRIDPGSEQARSGIEECLRLRPR